MLFKLLLLVHIIFTGCIGGQKKPASKKPALPQDQSNNTDSNEEKHSYELTYNGCSTGKQEFESEKSLCQGLIDEDLNNGCAKKLRSDMFEAKNCQTYGLTNNIMSTNSTATGDDDEPSDDTSGADQDLIDVPETAVLNAKFSDIEYEETIESGKFVFRTRSTIIDLKLDPALPEGYELATEGIVLGFLPKSGNFGNCPQVELIGKIVANISLKPDLSSGFVEFTYKTSNSSSLTISQQDCANYIKMIETDGFQGSRSNVYVNDALGDSAGKISALTIELSN